MIRVNYCSGRENIRASLRANKSALVRVVTAVIFLTACVIVVLKLFQDFLTGVSFFIVTDTLLMVAGTAYIGFIWAELILLAVRMWVLLFVLLFKEEKMTVSFEMYDDRTVNVIENEKERKTYTYAYEYITKAVEHKGYFTVNTKENSLSFAYSDITEGDPMALRALFQEKLGNRFTVK